MIEITCVYKGSPMSLDVKYKTGKKILDFRYGAILTSEVVNEEDLKRSIESGILKQYIAKGWVLPKKVNVYGAIQGAPVEFKGITADEAVRELEKQALAEKQDIEIKEDKKEEPAVEGSDKIVEALENQDENEQLEQEVDNMTKLNAVEVGNQTTEKTLTVEVDKPKAKRGRKPKAASVTNIEAVSTEKTEIETPGEEKEDDFL